MKAGLNLIDNFLWETFEIDWRTNVRRNARNIEEEKIDESKLDLLIKKYSLNLQFINRMKRDPGFKQYLITEIENDDEIIVKLKNYVNDIERKYIGNSFDSLFNLDNIDTSSANTEFDTNLEYDFETCEHEEKTNHKETKLAFLKNRLQIAKAKNDLDEKVSVESLLFEVENGFIGCYDLFHKNTPYQKSINTSHSSLNSRSIKYAAENLKSSDIYLERNASTYLRYLPELELELVHKILQLHPTKPQVEKISINKYAKFVLDCLDVSFVLWFESKDEQQKLSILNCNYEFTLNDSDIHKFINFHGAQELAKLTQILYHQNYFFECKILFEHLWNVFELNGDKRTYVSNMAVCCREIGEYKLAIRGHLEENKLICEAEKELEDIFLAFNGTIIDLKSNQVPNIPELKELQRLKAISFKNIAENYLYLGDEEKAEEYLSQAFEIAEKLGIKYKINLYFNAACAYRRNYKNSEEYSYLLKCKSLMESLEDREFKKSIEESIYERLDEYKKYTKNNLSENKKNSLNKIGLEDRYHFANKFVEKGYEFINTFQFSKAIVYFKRANQILESTYLNYAIVQCYFYLYLQEKEQQNRDKLLELLACTKKYFGEIKPNELFKKINKNLFLLAGFTIIAEGIETHNSQIIAVGVGFLKKHIHFIYSINSDNHDDILASLDKCLIFALQFRNYRMVKGIFDELVNEIEKYEKITSPYLLVGAAFVNYFIDDFAFYYFDKGLEEEKTKSKRIDLLDMKGYLNVIISKPKKAITCYEDALKLENTDSELWFKLSFAYSKSLQYTKAKDAMKKSIEFMPKNDQMYKEANKLLKQYTELSKEQLDIESLPEDIEVVKSSLISAEEELLEFGNPDYSGALVKYSKAIQIIMGENVAKPIASKIKNKNNKLNLKNYIKNKQNPLLFNKILHEGTSPGLGQWSQINRDLKKSKNDKISLEIKDELLKALDFESINALEQLGKILQPTRNKGSHNDIIDLDTATVIRNKAIPFLNKIITYFY